MMAILGPRQREREELRHLREAQAAYRDRFLVSSVDPFTPEEPEELERREAAERATAEQRQAALDRAKGLLEEHVGPDAMAKIANGGGYSIPSRWWPDDVIYMVPRNPSERILVLQKGALVQDKLTESCVVTTNYYLPWPDVMLQRIRAIELDESIVWNTGVLHRRKNGKVSWFRRILG